MNLYYLWNMHIIKIVFKGSIVKKFSKYQVFPIVNINNFKNFKIYYFILNIILDMTILFFNIFPFFSKSLIKIDPIIIAAINVAYILLKLILFLSIRTFIFFLVKNKIRKNLKIKCKSLSYIKENNDEKKELNYFEYDMDLTIKLNFFALHWIKINAVTKDSESESTEIFLHFENRDLTIRYFYFNEPNEKAKKENKITKHKGESKLTFKNNKDIDFHYFNNNNERISWLIEADEI